MLGVDVDITERKQAENVIRSTLVERETLLKEVHHRVKNNLQVISSLLHMQSLHAADKDTAELFRESQHRVRSMALVHERLYRSQDFVRVDLSEYINGLANYLFRSYQMDTDCIRLKVNTYEVRLPIDAAVPCGLIVNELISNCLKHAFRGRGEGNIHVELVPLTEGEALLCVSDDGVGLPPDVNPETASTFGMQLIVALVDQLHGRLEVSRQAGTTVRIVFPLAK
jgi:two-component sensor histidine kinase